MRTLCCLLSLLLTASLLAADQPATLKVGAASVAINPEIGTPLAGYFNDRPATGIHDDLHAKALVIEQGGSKAALVVLDLLTTPRQVIEKARELIAHDTGIPADHVMISATHTHTGPLMMIGSVRDPSEGGEKNLSESYTAALPGLIAKAVKEANDKLAPAVASGGHGQVEGISFNRRYVMRDGSVGWNPGKLNPKILHPAGPIDPGVGVLYFQTPDPKAPQPIATYVNFACHPDCTGGTVVSADYPGAVARFLGLVKGPDMVTIFANGTCGDINHIDVTTNRPQQGFEEAQRIGAVLAGETLRTFGHLDPVDIGPIKVRSEMVTLPLPPFTPEELVKARHDATTFAGPTKPSFLDRVKAFKILDTAARQGKPYEVEVQVISMGDDVAWVAMPGEIFVNLGLAIKEASPYRYTMIAELANGSIGYIPTRQAYAEGNYEPTNSRCAAGSGEMLVATAVRLLKETKK
jgi:neutral ceramidase